MTAVQQPAPLPAGSAAGREARVVELVGPAAAGKSTLLRLLDGNGAVRSGVRPPRRLHLASAVSLAPTFAALHQGARGVLWNEMKRMTYLRTLHRLLRRERARSRKPIVLDEGPVYMLARMRVYGGTAVASAAFERWWRGALDAWAGVLNLVVWLDAPDPVLIERLRTRPRWHRTRDAADEPIRAFLEAYRDAYRGILSGLTARGPVEVLRFDTAGAAADRLAGRIAAALREPGWRAP